MKLFGARIATKVGKDTRYFEAWFDVDVECEVFLDRVRADAITRKLRVEINELPGETHGGEAAAAFWRASLEN